MPFKVNLYILYLLYYFYIYIYNLYIYLTINILHIMLVQEKVDALTYSFNFKN